ncbi:MAG: ACT domain-containing protein [Actinomycetota bacterium]
MLFAIRISLPDRPGTLGAVATAFGKGGANILTLDIVESGGVAVDDLVVEAPEGMQEALRLAMDSVPGLVVEELRPLEAFQDYMSPLELAAALTEATEPVITTLIERLPEALRSDWCIVLKRCSSGLEVLGSGLGAPSLSDVEAPWMPLHGPTKLLPAAWMPASWTMGPASRDGQGKFELAAAPLSDAYNAVLIGRRKGPSFRQSELQQLGLLSRVAAAAAARQASKEAV